MALSASFSSSYASLMAQHAVHSSANTFHRKMNFSMKGTHSSKEDAMRGRRRDLRGCKV